MHCAFCGEERAESWKNGVQHTSFTPYLYSVTLCSPTIAIYIMRMNVENHGREHQEAMQVIREQFFMDDYLDIQETVEGTFITI